MKARIGQGKFRADWLKRWNNQCSLTGLANTDLLVASHIHAWSLSTMTNGSTLITDCCSPHMLIGFSTKG